MKRNTRVLIADDAEFIRILLTKHFEAIGCEVVGVAKDGKEGVKLYFELQPDLFVTDLVMPQMDGFEAISLILSKDKQAKIIVLSGTTDKNIEDKALALGAKLHIRKPLPAPHAFAHLLEKRGLIQPLEELPTEAVLVDPSSKNEPLSPTLTDEASVDINQPSDVSIEASGQPAPLHQPITSTGQMDENVPTLVDEIPDTQGTIDVLSRMRPPRESYLRQMEEHQLQKSEEARLEESTKIETPKKGSIFSKFFKK